MALSKLLLLPALFFSLLLLMVPSHCKEDPTFTTSAISQATSTICGKTAGLLQYRRIQCPKFANSADSMAVVPSLPKILPSLCMLDLCCGSGVICKKSDRGTTESWQISSEIIERPRALSQTVWEIMHTGWTVHAILVVFCVGCFISFVVYCTGDAEDDVPQDEENLIDAAIGNVQEFSFNELRIITNNFGTCIGSGGFGTIFEGLLPNNRQVAVKRRNKRLFGSSQENAFRTELETLSEIRHENVIELIGYCTENNEQILVYEFMSRKDLYGLLHPGFCEDDDSMLYSSWKLRVKVLVDVAKGIEYLHKNAEPRIIHRDIKSSNILIDEKWVAKISDFGIAVFGPEPGSNYVALEMPTGTDGYLDPECNANNPRATPLNDVYSFGVVMLEVVTGRAAIEAYKELPDFAPPLITSGDLMGVLDKRLAVPVGCELEAVIRVAQLATECVKVPGVDRPDMSAVVTELEGVLALFGPSEASTS